MCILKKKKSRKAEWLQCPSINQTILLDILIAINANNFFKCYVGLARSQSSFEDNYACFRKSLSIRKIILAI